MATIRPLDPTLVNKIAAGEVIERPASVVKELVENALDAGATRIDIVLEEGGVQLIRVTDNGAGIPSIELPLAVAAHATSKIATTDDLFNIRTLGFRGEALASVAAVSHFRIVSRTADQQEAHELRLLGGVPPENTSGRPQTCSAPPGTTVEVRNLFFNVPARRKFLRQAATEMANVTEQIARLALAHPGIAFGVSHNGRESRALPAVADRRSRIADFYGPELSSCLLTVHRVERGMTIDALIAPPAQSRTSTKWQYLFLNGRFIADRRLAFAVREAYRGLVEHDRFPVVFIFLTVDPQSFDVNVHPTKLEVRWRDAGLVQSQVLAVLRETLLSYDLTPNLSLHRTSDGPVVDGDSPLQARTRQAIADYLKRIDPTQARMTFQPQRFASENVRPSLSMTFDPPNLASPSRAESQVPAPTSVVSQSSDESRMEGAQSRESNDVVAAYAQSQFPATNAALPVIQVHNTYLVAQTEEGLVIIDQHALHERILYEKFRQRLLAGPLESQRLLMPPTLDASPVQVQAVERCGDLLHTLGIEISAYGPRSLAVQSFPVLLGDIDSAAFVADLLDKLAECSEGQSPETLVHAALDMMACKAAIKAGDALTTEEMHALLAQRHLTDRASNCPHGRPTTLQLSTRDLERQFKRV